jgi:hypothetical protein
MDPIRGILVCIQTNRARVSASSSISFSVVSCGIIANFGGVRGAPRVILPRDDR